MLFKGAKIIGQGITGSEGSRASLWMKEYGTNLVAGVTPGKGGQNLLGVPVFNTVKEAVDEIGEVDASVQYVPPLLTLKATTEALESGIKFLLITAEKVPVRDGAAIYALSQRFGAKIIGPSSVGLINPEFRLKIGSIGGGMPDRVFVPGNVAVISKSGSMTSEIGLHLKNNGMGVSWALGIGGDRIAGTDFADFLLDLENDDQTNASVIFGELGGTYEERVAKLVSEGSIKKPVVAFIAGEFTMSLPHEVQFGHAGAIIEGTKGLPDQKRKVLGEAGVMIAGSIDEIAGLVKKAVG